MNLIRTTIILLLILVFAPWNGIQAGNGVVHNDCSASGSISEVMSCCDMGLSKKSAEPYSPTHSNHQASDTSCCISGMCSDVFRPSADTVCPQRLAIHIPAPVELVQQSDTSPAAAQRIPVPPLVFFRPVELHIRNCAFLI